MAAHGGEDRDLDETKVEVALRKSARERKPNPKYASFFDDLHRKGLKDDLEKHAKAIETMLNEISRLDVIVNRKGVQLRFDKMALEWQNFQRAYNEYATLSVDSKELSAIGIRRQQLQRKISDSRQIFISTLENPNSITIAEEVHSQSEINDNKSDISRASSANSRRSSTSSKARSAARSAQIAKLKLQQAERKSKLKQRQIKELVELEKTRVELESKRAQAELEEKLQDLRDEAECAQYEAELLAVDERLENETLSSSRDQRLNLRNEIPEPPMEENVTLVDKKASTSTPNQERPFSSELEGYQPLPLTTPKEEVKGNLMEQGNPSAGKGTPLSDKTNQSILDQSLADALVQMNQQLVGVMKQNAETTTVMKAMLQRQGIPKPNPPKFAGDSAEFPVFKQRMQDWLDEKGFTEKEKVTYLLSFVDGDAKEAIKHCEIEGDGYSEAMTILEGQYGHPAKVVSACIRRITEGPRIESGDKEALIKLRNHLRTCLKVLRHNESYRHEINASANIERVIDRLPYHMQMDWAKKVPKVRDETATGPDLSHVFDLVNRQVRIMNDPQFGHLATRSKASVSAPKQGRQAALSNNSNPLRQLSTMATSVEDTEAQLAAPCPCCTERHLLKHCKVFERKSVEERWEIVKERKLCHICLTAGHMRAECASREKCACQTIYPHNKLLHRNSPSQQVPSSANHSSDRGSEDKGRVESYTTLTDENRKTVVLLHVVPVKVLSNGGKSLTTYGLLDNGSRGTIISSDIAERLNIDGPALPVAVTTVLGRQDRTFKEVSFALQAAEPAEGEPVLNVKGGLVGDLDINEKVLPHEINYERYPHLSDISIPEVEIKKVSVIIGEDVRKAHIVKEVRVSEDENCDLYATKTALGWTIAGTMEGKTDEQREVSVNFIDSDKLLLRQVENFWSMEKIGLEDKVHRSASVEDRRAESILQKTTRMTEGHYETGLLWKNDNPQLPNNRKIAEARLSSLKRKFQKDPELEGKYRRTMQDYIDRGYARKLSNLEAKTTSSKTNYLPHHAVLNPNKPGKVRVVFDAAAKHEGTSLNQNLLQGPDMTNNLVGVLLRFRQDRTALMADVEAMFHQVKVAPEDQDAFRFLWWSSDTDKPPDEYVMTVHVFGATDSPCCANYSLKRTAEDNRDKYDPIVIDTVLRHFYVDDMLRALKNEEIAIRVANDLMSLLARGGFRLTKFMSNSPTVLEAIPNDERAAPSINLDLDELPVERALGVGWNVKEDTFGFKVISCDKPDTMRGVLSCVSSFYDPLGFAAPVVLPAKQILQDCWKRKWSWDKPLEGQLLQRWCQWKSLLPLMTKVQVPRCFFRCTIDLKQVEIQIHHFCDASEEGYGTVSYLRTKYPDETISCAFLLGKSRNAPIRAPTIPRMELQSAVLAVRMNKFIQTELELPISETTFWTDSTITLFCIRNENKRFKTYVANRINEINEATDVDQWRHCPGKLNPADDCSRGLDPQQFLANERWLRGPQFLWEREEHWPQNKVEDIPVDRLELKKEKTITMTDVEGRTQCKLYELLERHSSWTKLLKSVAWIGKFIEWLKNGKRATHKRVTTSDIKKASVVVVALVQQQTFQQEIHDLTRKRSKSSDRQGVSPSSKIVKLKPMINEGERIIRVSGRINEAPITYDAKHQIILPQRHHVTTLLIRHYHEQLGHCGQEHLLSKLRERFWIIKGRSEIKRVIGGCFACRRRYAERMTQEMAELPKIRVTPYEPPFTFTGIDYFGPLQVKRGRGTAKRYGCIFVCMTSRAVHLELAQSLETDAFIMVLRRFLNTRGSVKQLRSDNGSNFIGAERELRQAIEQWNHRQIEDELRVRDCDWVFHPPDAPHMSGVWERLIRSVKRSMKAILGERMVDEEVLRTVLSEAQGIANSRPLCPNSDDVTDMEALTPNHLLLQRPATNLPTGNFSDADLVSRKKWRQSQVLADHYWKRWLHEYLPTLQKRQKWTSPRRNLAVDDLVLVADQKVPRGHWLLGRVTRVFPGRDGLVRTVEVKTKGSTLIRPIRKLCLLEAATD